MSVISYSELCELVEAGIINAKPSQINGSSIDLTLDSIIRIESPNTHGKPIDLASKENIITTPINLTYPPYHCGYILQPNEMILASTSEIFNLPHNISAEYKLKSSMARNGLEHLNAGWCDAGWTNSKLTLELKNVTRHHKLLLTVGMPIGQVIFYKHETVPTDKSYSVRGQYNNQIEVTESKGIR
ncbi:Dcd Deoxycytidine deaminase [uncultured Caudovirales phage]|uniref:Dcd Deoxycytidine deaminase n=1 Tax=uncultured Caudovirales phage TaxID=2100421 RepID=A0A6J5PBN3_9CAUD|nr:Dcd Deoxycytidine deaminase [uncultured Caudovirales phage]CAB5226895.1 Dcd Deoxycytidine deaminase [uncultured Caudovirales phage]